MSKQEKLLKHKIYFPISKTAGITPEYLDEAREKYLRGELIEGVDYREKQ
jgi:hypothetical protein